MYRKQITENSIRVPSRFELYFSYSILNDKLSHIVFSILRKNGDLVAFYKKIDEWCSEGLEGQLEAKLNRIKSFDNVIDYENIVQCFLYLGEKLSDRSEKEEWKFLYNQNHLVYIFSNKYNYSGANEHKEFIFKVLRSGKSPFCSVVDLIYKISRKYKPNFPLTNDELLEINISYLKKYLSEPVIEIYNLWFLYFRSINKTVWEKEGSNSFVQKTIRVREADIELKEFFFKQKVKTVIEILLLSSYWSNNINVKKYGFRDDVRHIFGSWDEFYDYVISSKELNKEYEREFKNLYNALKENNFKLQVDFTLNEIKVRDKFTSQ